MIMKNLKSIITVCFLFLLLPIISFASEITGTIEQGQKNLEAQPANLEAGIMPGTISNLSASTGNNSGEVNLKWSIPSPAPAGWEVKYSTSKITSENYDTAKIYSQSWSGSSMSGTVSGLTPNATYYFAMKGIAGSLESEMSNVVSAKTNAPQNTGGGGNSGGGSNAPPSSQTANNVPLKISSSQQGTLNQNLNSKNKIKVEVPKGSIKSTTTFTASAGSLAEDNVPKDKIGAFLFNGLVFNVNAADANGKAVRNFSENLTITLTVPDLPDDISTLELYYLDDENDKWVAITGVVFGKNTISFKVNHLTKFAVFTTKTGGVKGAENINILDGDIIQCQTCSQPYAVYIVKTAGNTKYIRHIVSLEIFNHYKHLKWENLKQVSSLNDYSLSGWVRYNTGENNTAGPTDKVYEINGDQTKHWINMTAEQFLTHGGSDPAIFNINQGELNLYIAGPDVMVL